MLPLAISTLAAVASASQAPFMTWSSSTASSSTPAEVLSGEGFSRENALSHVRALRESGGRRRALHFMLVDELHTDELTTMAHGDVAVSGALQAISADIVKGGAGSKDALVVSRAELHGDGLPSLREQIGAELKGCSVTEVVSTVAQTAGDAAVSDGVISRQQYEEILRATNLEAPALPECQAFIVPLAKASLADELKFLAKANRLANSNAASSQAAPEHVFVFTSEAAVEPSYASSNNAAEKAAGEAIVQSEGAKARMLQSGGSATTTLVYGNIQMQPEIVAGLVVGGFLLFIVWIGVSCTMSVRTPDVLHSTTLPAGKEY